MVIEVKEKIRNILENKKLCIYLVVCLMVCAGLVYVFTLYEYTVTKIVRYIVLVLFLVYIAWKDYHEKIIPNVALVAMLIVRVCILIAEWIVYPDLGLSMLMSAGLGALIGGGVFGLCYLISRGGMGAGDVKLLFVEGFYFGISSILPAMLAMTFCSAIYNIVMLLLKKITLKSELPFGPFVLAGTVIAMFLGV